MALQDGCKYFHGIAVDAAGPTCIVTLDVSEIEPMSTEWQDAFRESEPALQNLANQHPKITVKFVNMAGQTITP